jgi:hypothetical protein
MCVIMASVQGAKINEDWLKAGWDANDHGAGIAWREGQGKKAGVRFIKGLMTIEETIEAYSKVPENVPHVVHFRIASVGGKLPELTHPFLINEDSTLNMEGLTKQPLLFHNGHLNSWKAWLTETAQRSGGTIKVPDGPWSDSRAMAFLTHHLGKGMMNFFDEKLVYLSPDRFDIYGPSQYAWTLREKIHLSNTGWESRVKRGTHYHGSSPRSVERMGESSGNVTQGVPGVTPATAPFPQEANVEVLRMNSQEIEMPQGMSRKAARRWRRRMARKGFLPAGPIRHQERQMQKYQSK